MTKRILALLLALMTLVSLVACSSGNAPAADKPAADKPAADAPAAETPAEVKYKDEVILGTAYDLTTTDPQASNSDAAMQNFIMTHETLTDLVDGKVVPLLATWEQPDPLIFIFTIPDNVTFTNGTPCKASDIKFTFDRARESSFTSGKIETVESVEVLSDTQVQFKMSAPNQDFLTTLAHRSLSILSEKAVTEDPINGPSIGCGKFFLKEWIPGDHFTVERYDGYYGEKAPTKYFTTRIITESAASLIALQTGEIDITDVDTLDIPTVEADENLEMVQIPDVTMKYFAFNVNAEPFTDPAVRKAVAQAINKQNIIDGAFSGQAIMHHSVVNVGQYALDTSIKGYEYNPEKAKQMLADAGYPNGLDIRLSVYNTQPNQMIAEIIQADMAEAGIRVTLEPLEPVALKAMMKEGGHQCSIYNWTDADGTDFTVRSLFYSTSGSNRCKVQDPVLDKMIDDALVETDDATRIQMYYDIQAYCYERDFIIPTNVGYINEAVRKGVSGAIFKSTGKHDFRNVVAIAG